MINQVNDNVKEFQSKTGPENIKWRIAHMCLLEDKA